MNKFQRLLIILTLLSLGLSACNLPGSATQAVSPGAAFTAAAQTVEAQLTQNALLVPPTNTPAPIPPTDTPVPVLPSNTPVPPSPTPTPYCDLAQFVSDVTIPDGTQMLPGQTFTKTWRLQNMGVCTWSTSYQVIFDNGNVMGATSPQSLAGNVAPNQTVDISVSMTAPTTPGAYRGYWRLRNAAGVLIPILNGYQGQSFYVDIKVVAPTATPTLTATPTATPTATLIPLTLLPLTLIPPIILTP